MAPLRSRARTWAKVALACVWIVPVELSARWYCREHGDALERTSLLLRADAFLGWRHRGDLSDLFLGRPVHTNSEGFRGRSLSRLDNGVVLVLGPSSTFGWGVGDEETYAAQADGRFANGAGAPAVLNAGQIGFSSFQGVRLSRSPELARLRWRALVVAYGVNDVDHLRFYDATSRPDAEEYDGKKNPFAVALLNGLTDLHFLDLARRRIQRFLFVHACAPAFVPNVRVNATAYERNLRTLADEAKTRGAPVIFLNTAFRYAEKPELPPESVQSAAERLATASAAWETGDAVAARDLALSSIRQEPGVDRAWYLLSAAESALGHCRASREAFAHGREREPFRLHAELEQYNAIMRRVAGDLGAGFIDVQTLLSSAPGTLLDPIHPSARGHAMIAEALSAALLARGIPR